MPIQGNLFADVPETLPEEEFKTLWQRPDLKIERIVSRGHATPEGEWYDQEQDEWVVLLSGEAVLRIEGQEELHAMQAGDWLLLPAHCRHRMERTDARQACVWLAVHVDP